MRCALPTLLSNACQFHHNRKHYIFHTKIYIQHKIYKSRNHLIKFRGYLNKCHSRMKFSFEEKKNGKLSFLDIEVSREGNKFATTVYRKPIFSGVYTHFDSFFTYYI